MYSFHASQAAFRAALCDSFNTPAALDVLRELVSKTNVYINSRGKNLNVKLVETIARWVGKMLRMFGLGEEEDIGWGQDSQQTGNINVGFHLLDVFSLQLTLVLIREEKC